LWSRIHPEIVIPNVVPVKMDITYYIILFELLFDILVGDYPSESVFIFCDKRQQILLLLLQGMKRAHLPKKVYILTRDPLDGWLARRVPNYLKNVVVFTTNPEDVS